MRALASRERLVLGFGVGLRHETTNAITASSFRPQFSSQSELSWRGQSYDRSQKPFCTAMEGFLVFVRRILTATIRKDRRGAEKMERFAEGFLAPHSARLRALGRVFALWVDFPPPRGAHPSEVAAKVLVVAGVPSGEPRTSHSSPRLCGCLSLAARLRRAPFCGHSLFIGGSPRRSSNRSPPQIQTGGI